MSRSSSQTGSREPARDLPYRALFEVHPHPMWVFDRDTLGFLLVNEAAVRHYGHTREEFASMTVDELHPDADRGSVREQLEGAPRGVADEGIWRHRNRVGHEFPVRITSHDVRMDAGWARLVQAEDITEEVDARREQAEALADERQARERAEEAEDRYRRAFESAAVGILLTGADGRIQYANPFFCDMLGYTADEVAGRKVLDFAHPLDRGEFSARLAELVQGRRSALLLENRGQRKDGSPVWVRGSASTLRSPEGELTHLFCVVQDLTEEREAEERLRESRRLQKIAGSIGRVGGWSIDLSEGVVRWSDQVCAIHEAPPGTSPSVEEGLEYYAPEWRPVIQEHFTRCAEEGVPYDLELELLTATGRRIWVRAAGVPVRNEAGEVVAVEGAFQDISSQKEHLFEVRRLANRLVRILESITDAFFALDREWRFTYVNQEAERVLERSRKELLGKGIWDAFPDAVGSEFHTRYEEAARTGASEHFEAHYPAFDTWFAVHAYPSAEGLSVFFQDVSAERRARAALRDSEERFRLVARATTDVIWDWNAETDELWWGEGMQTLFGFAQEELEPGSSSWSRRVHPDDREEVVRSIRNVIDGDTDLWEEEYRFQRSDGSYARVQDRGYVIRDAEGRATRMIGGMADVTDARRMEAQLLRAQRMESIGNLAGGIAHDLNNVLTPILISSDLLERLVDDDRSREVLTSIQISARRAVELVRQVLSFARGMEGKHGPVSIENVAAEVQRVARETFPRDISLEFHMDPGLHHILGDTTQLHQVLLNLYMNARDAMPDGGRLDVTLENVRMDQERAHAGGVAVAGRYVRVEVRDTGIGMSPEVLEQIFDPFFTTKEAGGGTGLGLSVVASIVRTHGGSFSVESQPGEGTRFELYFPAAEPSAAGSAEAPVPVAELRRGQGEWILVVDDEPAVRAAARRTLVAFGYQVRTAAEGGEALDALAEMDDVSAVVTDLMMPGVGGAELIATLRARYPDLPIVAASGLEPDEGTAEAIGRGEVGFLPKPFTTDELLLAVQEALADRTPRR